MTRINLRDYYPFYVADCFIDVPDEIAALLLAQARYEAAYQRQTYRHRAYFSLNRDDGIEHDILFLLLSPCEIYERKITNEQLYAAIANLPDKQAKRIYAHFFLGLSIGEIARSEGVSPASISGSIARGLRTLEKYLKKSL
ncbi:MAG: sigma factor-like helix-turn-helix DNA-binding protein [Bacillota bacterium]